MLKKILQIGIVLAMLMMVVPVAKAEKIRIEIDGICCEKGYKLYDHEDKEADGVSPYGNPESCYVLVDLDPVLTDEELEELEQQKAAVEAAKKAEPARTGPRQESYREQIAGYVTEDVPEGFVGAAESLLSPLAALFEGVGIKKALIDLANYVFEGHTELYHQFMDEQIFGMAIQDVSRHESSKSLNEYLEELKEKEASKGCSSESPRPDCVIERAMCSYEKYVGVLFHQSGQSIAQDVLQTEDIAGVFAMMQRRDQALLEEASQAHNALSTAIEVYNQFYQTYRLHLKFKEIIESLVMVRESTGYLRELVGCLPNKFVGVSTTKCN